MSTKSLFDLDLDGTETLSEEERLVLLRLLATEVITESQAQRVIDTHKPTRLLFWTFSVH